MNILRKASHSAAMAECRGVPPAIQAAIFECYRRAWLRETGKLPGDANLSLRCAARLERKYNVYPQ